MEAYETIRNRLYDSRDVFQHKEEQAYSIL